VKRDLYGDIGFSEPEGGVLTPSGYYVNTRRGANMKNTNEYTRQRQGRDFPKHRDIGKNNKSLIEQFKASVIEIEQFPAPVDGFEPPEIRGASPTVGR